MFPQSKGEGEGEKVERLEWRVNTPGLLQEIGNNNSMAILSKPLTIFGRLLFQVGERAAELNDPQLNALMCRLAIYAIADPNSPNYDGDKVDEILALVASSPSPEDK